MPKPLSTPLVVQAAQIADQVEIGSYTVDAQQKVVVKIQLKPSRLNDDGVTRTYFPDLSKDFDAATTQAAMVDATTEIVMAAVLAANDALVAANIDPTAVAAAMQATFTANPDLPWQLYYAGTRDAIYSRI